MLISQKYDCYTVVRFEQATSQEDYPIKRIIGFMSPKDIMRLLDNVTLDANPRSARANNVTADIIESLDREPELFQFKTKGILLGTGDYTQLQRNRYGLNSNNQHYEGLLDGGHNMLAIGTYLLSHVMEEKELKKIKFWKDFRESWETHKKEVKEKQNDFKFKVPAELLVPSSDDEETIKKFGLALMDICAARNNNVQLTTEAKANQRGFYDAIKKRMPDLAEHVEWKSNEWESDHTKPIKVRDLIALAWIPLSLLNDEGLLPKESENGSGLNFDVRPQKIYASKGELSKLFDRLMEHPDISKPTNGPHHELHNTAIGSAFEILKDIPKLYDTVFMRLPDAYNHGEGKFGRIKAVKYKDNKKIYKSPFFGEESSYGVPDGFVLPIIYGLKALMEVEDKKLKWICEPNKFLTNNMNEFTKAFKMPMKMADLDPQKVGKSEESYNLMVGEFEKALILQQNK